jgi:Tfp pilus assembly protein PilV
MNKKGFSYIEVLISMALLLIIIVPIISTLSQAQRTMTYAVDTYKANILVNNMVVDIERVIRTTNNFDTKFYEIKRGYKNYTLKEFLQNPAFDERYQTYKYYYSVFIQNIAGETIVIATKDVEREVVSKVLSDNYYIFKPHDNMALYDFYIIIDEGFITKKGNTNLKGDTLYINLENFAGDVYIKINVESLSSVKYIKILGEEKRIFLNIKIQENELLKINFGSKNNMIIKRYFKTNKQLSDYVITATIYNKNKVAIKSISKLVSS